MAAVTLYDRLTFSTAVLFFLQADVLVLVSRNHNFLALSHHGRNTPNSRASRGSLTVSGLL